ncbi:Heat shock protein 17 [Nymphaea thermarum]|nr:Heat shock protein 17 [Nymphaea thermarum]
MMKKIGTLWKIFLIVCIVSLVRLTPSESAVSSIDLGSEWMKVAVVNLKPGQPPISVAINEMSKRKSPGLVAFLAGDRLLGEEAFGISARYPEKVYSRTRDILAKPFPYVKTLMDSLYLSYDLVEDSRGSAGVRVEDGVVYSAEELVAMVLSYGRNLAGSHAKIGIKDAVIAVPAYFGQSERRELIQAAQLAGINVLGLINEHSGAALQYGIDKDFSNESRHVLFYHMGSSSTYAALAYFSSYPAKEFGRQVSINQFQQHMSYEYVFQLGVGIGPPSPARPDSPGLGPARPGPPRRSRQTTDRLSPSPTTDPLSPFLAAALLLLLLPPRRLFSLTDSFPPPRRSRPGVRGVERVGGDLATRLSRARMQPKVSVVEQRRVGLSEIRAGRRSGGQRRRGGGRRRRNGRLRRRGRGSGRRRRSGRRETEEEGERGTVGEGYLFPLPILNLLQIKDVRWIAELGGQSMELRLVEHFADEFNAQIGNEVDVRKFPKAMAKLKKQVKRTKEILSANTVAPISVESLYNDRDFRSTITREKFEELCGDLWENSLIPVKEILESSGLKVSDLYAVELIGGATRVPKLQFRP